MSKSTGIRNFIESLFTEDDLGRNQFYFQQLPQDKVKCQLKIKSDLILSGLPYFVASFEYLGAELYIDIQKWEGKFLEEGSNLTFDLPFAVALTGERIALNLLQKASSISTYTACFVEKAKKYNIAILDTRKTTPGLRALEKYAVRLGGGYNHRLGQSDVWMVKDNHKSFFGGVKAAVEFFRSMQGFYIPIIVEVHNDQEFQQCVELGISHVMLDNYSGEQIKKLVAQKPAHMTIEVSGGINLANIDEYLIDGVDALSVGSLTYAAPAVDLSLKCERA